MVPVDEAQRQIGEAWYSNAHYIDDLQRRLTAAQPIPLVPFVGAGLSMPMGVALLAEGKYEEVAETVERGLGPAIFNRRVAHTFGERKSQSCELQEAVLAPPDLVADAVVTTNFDRILERVSAEAGSLFDRVVRGSQVDSMRRVISENKFLLKIHGDAKERSSRVLTRLGYDKHYTPGDPDESTKKVGHLPKKASESMSRPDHGNGLLTKTPMI
jgi:SIR2-like domain